MKRINLGEPGIQITLGGKNFEAVGFLQVGEEMVTCREALRRTEGGHLIRTDEDWQVLHDHMGESPRELRTYRCMTHRKIPSNHDRVSGRSWTGIGWCGGFVNLDDDCDESFLMLRRVVDGR